MHKRIGEIFVARGLATAEDVRLALDEQSRSCPQRLLGQILIDRGVISRSQSQTPGPAPDARLLDLIARINSTIDTEHLLATIMSGAQELMEAEASSLMLLDPVTGDLRVAVPTGPVRAEILGTTIPRGRGFCGWVAEHGQPLVVSDAKSDPRFFGDIVDRFQTTDLICVPLRNQNGKILGVLEAINRRDGDHFVQDEIPLFSALADHVAIALERARLHEEELERQRLQQQLTWARQIQQGFLRKEMPRYDGIGLAAMNLPAVYVSGDYYDVIPIDDRRCALVIADVSGKGPPAALLMATFRAVLQSQAARGQSAEDTVRFTNDIMARDIPANSFVTLFYGVVDTVRRELTFVNAGHNPPIFYDPASSSLEPLRAGGPIIGFSAGVPFRSEIRPIHPDQLLVLYTDGVTEASTRSEEFFGQQRLEELIRRHAGDDAQTLLSRIRASIESFTEGAPQHDDITMLVMKAA